MKKSVLVGVLALTFSMAACGRAPDDASPTSSPSAASSGGPAGEDITFESGAGLDPSSLPEWADSMTGDPAYEVVDPDTGQGTWSYRDVASGCEISYLQTKVPGSEESSGDSELSAQFLASSNDAPVARVSEAADDTELALGLTGDATVEFKALFLARESGQQEVALVRAFGALDVVMRVVIECDGGTDTKAFAQQLVPELAVILS